MFRYARPGSLSEALALLAEHGEEARVLSGGTDLLVGLRKGKLSPSLVVDLKRVPELGGGIRVSEGAVDIPARTVMTDIIEHERIRRDHPALVEAAATVGSIQIRNRATLAGNLCNASPAADTAPPLLIHGASVEVAGAGGRRMVPLPHFLVGPGVTALERGELVTSIHLPAPPPGFGAAFARLTRRRGVDLATVSACCSVDERGVTRFALGAAGPRPVLVADEDGILADRGGREDRRRATLQALIAHATPISDVRAGKEYRMAMLEVLARRTLERALARRAGEEGA